MSQLAAGTIPESLRIELWTTIIIIIIIIIIIKHTPKIGAKRV